MGFLYNMGEFFDKLLSKKDKMLDNLDKFIVFNKSYDGKTISNDRRSMMIGNPRFAIFYGKWTTYKDTKYGTVSFYHNLVVDTKEQAFKARNKYCPPVNKIPRSVYFEIWTSDGNFIAGRDCLRDYELER